MSNHLTSDHPNGDPADHVREALASLALSGGKLSPEGEADAQEYASGAITHDELKRRTFERYGIDPDGAA